MNDEMLAEAERILNAQNIFGEILPNGEFKADLLSYFSFEKTGEARIEIQGSDSSAKSIQISISEKEGYFVLLEPSGDRAQIGSYSLESEDGFKTKNGGKLGARVGVYYTYASLSDFVDLRLEISKSLEGDHYFIYLNEGISNDILVIARYKK